MKKSIALLALLLLVCTVYAQETIDSTKNTPLQISGGADVYYQYNFNGLPLETTAYTGDHNSFSLGMAKVALEKQMGKTSFRADVGFGPRAAAANGENYPNLQQLFVTYSPIEELTFTLGNFGTHVGYEMIDPTDNAHYSLSYMFSYGPFFHTGLKVDYAVNDKLGLMIGIFDDTDSKFDIITNKKHFGAQVSYATDLGNIYLNYLSGTNGAEDDTFNQVDLAADFALNDELSLGLNSTVKSIKNGTRDAVNWYGAAIYLGYAVKENVSLHLRNEYIQDSTDEIFERPFSANTPDNISLVATTLSANIQIDNLTLIPEFRVDSASEDIFAKSDGSVDRTSTSPTFIFAAVYAF